MSKYFLYIVYFLFNPLPAGGAGHPKIDLLYPPIPTPRYLIITPIPSRLKNIFQFFLAVGHLSYAAIQLGVTNIKQVELLDTSFKKKVCRKINRHCSFS